MMSTMSLLILYYLQKIIKPYYYYLVELKMNNIGTLNDQSVNQTKSMEIYFYFRSILFFFVCFINRKF